MKPYPFYQVDAFTDRPLGGNPCAVVLDADDLSDETMLAVAREMNLSETAFVTRSDAADFGVRYFTPAEEIPLAGHPTLATTFTLVEAGRLQLAGAHTRITLEMKAGVIPVDIHARDGKVGQMIMTQKRPEFLRTYAPDAVAPAFSLAPEDLLPDFPLQTVSTGTPQLMIPLKHLETLHKTRVDVPAYETLRQSGDFFSPHLFCLGGVTEAGHTFARHFGAPPDTPEDPFTGSATGGMAAYLWRYGLLERPEFTAEQGHWMGRPGTARVQVVGPREDIEAVRVGGGAALVVRGEILI